MGTRKVVTDKMTGNFQLVDVGSQEILPLKEQGGTTPTSTKNGIGEKE